MSTVRVMVHEMWDEVTLPFDADQSVRDLKASALRAARVGADPAAFEVKYRGARVLDESARLEDAGIPPGAALIVLRTRRRAVR